MNATQASDFFVRCIEKGRIPHAFIVHGGTFEQRYDVSLKAVKILECEKSPNVCETCYHCRAISSNNHPDISRVKPEKRNLSIDEVRTIKQDMYMKPYSGRYKIFIIETDWMQAPAANSLLKILEEPPEYGIMIILARNNKNFLPTIVSRTINIRINPEIEAPDVDKKNSEYLEKIIQSAERKNWRNFFSMCAEIAKNVSREEFENIFEIIVMTARYNLLKDTEITDKNLKGTNQKSIINTVSHSQIEELLDKRTYLRFNVNSRIILERIILELISPKWRNWQTR
ncbi:MAG TPA: hypothetical protein PLB98_00105 [bacterium]|nr:hypothetical protein [bacterium]